MKFSIHVRLAEHQRPFLYKHLISLSHSHYQKTNYKPELEIMNMNRQSIIAIAFFFSLLLVTSSTYVDVSQIYPSPVVMKKVDENTHILKTHWDENKKQENGFNFIFKKNSYPLLTN